MKKPFFKRKVVLLGIVLLVIMIAVVASAANNPSTISGTSKSPGTSQNKAMKISYTVVNLGDASQWDPSIAPGSAFLVVNMTIHNQGYDTFSVNPFYFKAVVDNVAYSYSTYSYKLGDEGYTRLGVASVLDGGTITGALAFEVPQGYSQVSMQYQGLRTYSAHKCQARTLLFTPSDSSVRIPRSLSSDLSRDRVKPLARLWATASRLLVGHVQI